MAKNLKKEKFILVLCLLAALIMALAAAGCAENTENDSRIKVVYELEGGKYLNSELPIVVYYNFGDKGETHRIRELTEVTAESLTRAGYTFGGWYRQKSGDGDEAVYSEMWNFETDLIGKEGVTLYAKWQPNIEYKYSMYYRDGDELVFYKSEILYKGEQFDNDKAKRTGYTVLACYDENFDPWDYSFENDVGDVKVIVDYIEGEYKLVGSYAELKSSVTKNIYLTADIDCGGEDFNFGDYSGKTLKGNGYTISNFALGGDQTLKTDPFGNQNALLISLFGSMKNTVIEDVNFKDVKITVSARLQKTRKVYVSPIAIMAENCKISGVTFEGKVELGKFYDGFDMSDLTVVTDSECVDSKNSEFFGNEIELEKINF